jgi:TolB-like protein
MAVAVALLFAIAASALFWRSGQVADDEERGPSLIVLPFAVLSPQKDDGFLAAGMTQELIAQLMRFPDLRLFSTPASFAQNPAADPRELGRRLGTTYVVQGTVRSEDGLVHVRAMLTDADTGEVLWSGTYDRPLSPGDIFTVQEQISTEISTTLGQPYGVLPGNEVNRLTGSPSLSSYACVLRAYDYRRSFDEGQYGLMVACLEAAVARDPDYADAWAMLGWLHLDAGRFDMGVLGALCIGSPVRFHSDRSQPWMGLKRSSNMMAN